MKKYAILIACAVLFASCGKSMDYYYLTNTIKSLVPYQLGDNERFINGNGDVVTLTVNSIEDDWWQETEGAFVEWGMAAQYQRVKLESEDGRDGISLRIIEWDWPYSHDPRVDLFLPTGRWAIIRFDMSGNFTNAVVYDSISIGGQMYYDVAKRQLVTDDKNDTASYCYYSKTHGLLQAKGNGRLIYERLP